VLVPGGWQEAVATGHVPSLVKVCGSAKALG